APNLSVAGSHGGCLPTRALRGTEKVEVAGGFRPPAAAAGCAGCGRQGQAWRCAGDLRGHSGCADLVAGNPCQEPTGKSAGACHKADQGPYGEVMKKLSKEILARDAKRDIGAEVLEAIREIKAGGGRKFTVQVSQATEARIKLGQSQVDFAEM